jgi:hypothetical protein
MMYITESTNNRPSKSNLSLDTTSSRLKGFIKKQWFGRKLIGY